MTSNFKLVHGLVKSSLVPSLLNFSRKNLQLACGVIYERSFGEKILLCLPAVFNFFPFSAILSIRNSEPVLTFFLFFPFLFFYLFISLTQFFPSLVRKTVCVSACVCERERERESSKKNDSTHTHTHLLLRMSRGFLFYIGYPLVSQSFVSL